MANSLQKELLYLNREILGLKTGEKKPGTSTMYRQSVVIPAGDYSGIYTFTIRYKDVGDTSAPITTSNYDAGWTLLDYNASGNTQKIEWAVENTTLGGAQTVYVYSTRPIESITRDF
jgi:hypothetical protein